MKIPNSKQQQLTFDKGITNVPSDAICSDNALSLCDGLTYEDGEHKVVQEPYPKSELTSSYKLIFAHKLQNGQTNYIYEGDDGLYFNNRLISDSNHSKQIRNDQIRAIGRTLIVLLDSRITYFLFTDGDYKYIGNKIPNPEVYFGLFGEPGALVSDLGKVTVFKYIKADGSVGGVSSEYDITDKTLFDNSTKGLYANAKKKAAQQKAFVKPFFIRYALKLFDGSYMHISNPIPLFPNAANTCFYNVNGLYVHAMHVQYLSLVSFSDWTDIVKAISVFISDGIEFYDLGLDAVAQSERGLHLEYDVTRCSTAGVGQDDVYRVNGHYCFRYRSWSELQDDLCSESVFYHLCDLKATTKVSTWKNLRDHYSHTVLENLTTQEQLPYDNFYSLAPLYAGSLFDYNNRLHLTNIKRGFFAGFSQFTGIWESLSATDHAYTIYVRIRSESGTRVVKHQITSSRERIEIYFFYPDPRADYVTILQDGQCIVDAALIEHQGLNGAYYCDGWPQAGWSASSRPQTLDDRDVYTEPEELLSFMATSEVNNPFLFKAEGFYKVGNGVIIGLASQTHALSQGQFGQFPLLIFTTEGIFTMTVSNTGLYDTTHPMSREVALKDNPCITQTDGSVFFASKKGLMQIIGAQVRCVSQQLSGCVTDENDETIMSIPFCRYLERAMIAYDYRDSLLWIFNNDEFSNSQCYLYNMKSGTFSIKSLAYAATNVVNDYPDYLVQSGELVLSLMERPDCNEDERNYYAHIITRPMKLENAFALKKIIQVLHVAQMKGSLSLRVFASNDINQPNSWVQLHSLLGTPWKYYRFQYSFSNLRATDRFAGSIVVTEEIRSDKLR